VQARIWTKMTVEELQEALQETQTVLIPLGIAEQHGYHLAVGTDIHNAEQMCRRAAEQTGCFVAPTLNYAFSGGELLGTINIAPPVYASFIMEILRDLCRQGLKNLILVAGHGGTDNTYAIRSAAETFLRLNPCYADRNVAVYLCWEYGHYWKESFAEGDFHSGWVETSLMKYWAPEDVREERVMLDEPEFTQLMREDQDAYEISERHVDHPAVIARKYQSPRMKIGVMGYPERATAEKGEKICAEMVAGLVELIRAMEAS